MNMTEKTISEDIFYKGKILKFHVDKVKLENGRTSTRECVDHPGGVSIAALTAENELYFVRQYRYPYHETVLELPAGKLEKGENPLVAGKRELREETGVEGESYISLGKLYPSPGYTSEVIWLYACREKSRGDTHFDTDEFIKIEKIPMKEAVRKVLSNEIPDAKTQILILKLAAYQKNSTECGVQRKQGDNTAAGSRL